MTTILEMTDEKFQEIYSSKELRNAVANSHECCDKFHKFKHRQTCQYPVAYIVTKEQIEIAKELQRQSAIQTLEKHKHDLLFVGMGLDYKGDVENFRIRTVFLNKHGEKIFVEFSGEEGKRGYCLHSDKMLDDDKFIRNYKGLERSFEMLYTKENILNTVNKTFDCNFANIVIDNYDIWMKGFEPICISPNYDTKKEDPSSPEYS